MKHLFSLILILSTSIVTAQKIKKGTDQLPPEIQKLFNKKNYFNKESYWMLMKSSDSTCKIKWHTLSTTRVTEENFAIYNTERFRLEWKSKDFIALHSFTGSGEWFDVFLPLKKKGREIIIDCPIAFDKYNNLVAQIYYGDTIIKVTNLRSRKEQSIIEKKRKCSSASNSFCIDKVYFSQNTLIFSWILPNKLEDNSDRVAHKVKLHI